MCIMGNGEKAKSFFKLTIVDFLILGARCLGFELYCRLRFEVRREDSFLFFCHCVKVCDEKYSFRSLQYECR